MKLTIGMAVHTAFRDVWFVVKTLRMYHPLAREAEILVVDNAPGPLAEIEGNRVPTSPHGSTTYHFIKSLQDPMVRYIPMPEPVGTSAPRQRVFDEATGDVVLCMDSHVLLEEGALEALMRYFESHVESKDLVSGPMIYDHPGVNPCMFLDLWSAEMRGVWSPAWYCSCEKKVFGTLQDGNGNVALVDPLTLQPYTNCPQCKRALPAPMWYRHEPVLELEGLTAVGHKRYLPPFEVAGQGLGAFAMRKEAWPGFNREFRGFGGEELYIHEKVRRAGGKCICLPNFPWHHCFGNPEGMTYPITLWNKVRNYVIGHRELGLDVAPVYEHFVKNGKFTQEAWDKMISADPPLMEPAPQTGGTCCGGAAPEYPKTLDEWYQKVMTTQSDIFEHIPVLKELASKCEHVTEFGTRFCNSTAAFLAAQPKKLISYDLHPSHQAGKLKELEGATDFQFRLGDSRSVKLEETDMTFIDTVHTGAHVLAELDNAAPKTRKYLVFHDTEAPFGERGEDGGPGVLPAVREFLWKNPEWVVKKHYRNNHGLTILSRLPEDRKALPGILKQAWNFTKAQTRHALNGGKYLPLPLVQERAKECSICDQRNGEQCAVCGCYLRQVPDDASVKAGQPAKLFYPMEWCPIGKWQPRPNDGVDMTPDQIKQLMEAL